jgi:hypothetical protein
MELTFIGTGPGRINYAVFAGSVRGLHHVLLSLAMFDGVRRPYRLQIWRFFDTAGPVCALSQVWRILV